MKVLLVNKFYYRRGGDCIYVLNLEQLLKDKGHEVAVFAMDYPENLPTPWGKYFPSEVKFKPGLGMIEAFMRPFGTGEVKKKFTALLDEFKPDVVHLNNIHSQISPIVAEIAHARGIKVVWTIHDLKLLCPRYDCLRNGKVLCDECFRDKHAVLKYNCMKNSKVASYLSYKEAVKWSRERLESITDTFICPSRFMADMMRKGGFNRDKIRELCNFIDVEKCIKEDYTKENYYCYIGRLSHEKGVHTLVKAAGQLPYRLVVIGGGPLYDELSSNASGNIEFVGYKDWPDIKKLVGGAKFSVLGSEVYENNPLSVIEAQCLGTPVLGANIGGIPELINESNGMTFESGNVDDLVDKIKLMFDAKFDYPTIAKRAQDAYNDNAYYASLMQIYSK